MADVVTLSSLKIITQFFADVFILELNIEKETVNENIVISDSLFKWLSDYSFQLTDI